MIHNPIDRLTKNKKEINSVIFNSELIILILLGSLIGIIFVFKISDDISYIECDGEFLKVTEKKRYLIKRKS